MYRKLALFAACPSRRDELRQSPWLATALMVLVAFQAMLGMWTVTMLLKPAMDFANAFHVLRELGQTPEGALLSNEALTAIHWTHRMFALVVVAVVGWATLCTMRIFRGLGMAVVLLLLLQFSLGVANVWFQLPLWLAVAHNAGAALLLGAVVVLNFFAFRKLRS